jgi:hypothetical protein
MDRCFIKWFMQSFAYAELDMMGPSIGCLVGGPSLPYNYQLFKFWVLVCGTLDTAYNKATPCLPCTVALWIWDANIWEVCSYWKRNHFEMVMKREDNWYHSWHVLVQYISYLLTKTLAQNVSCLGTACVLISCYLWSISMWCVKWYVSYVLPVVKRII